MANVHRDGIWPENLFDPDHVAAYREQLHRINLTNRFRIARDGSMEFTASSGGNVQHSSEKGYAYLVTAPDSLCLDLDEASKKDAAPSRTAGGRAIATSRGTGTSISPGIECCGKSAPARPV